MSYCTLDDLQRDELLKTSVSNDDIAEADAYVNDLSWSVGIDPIRIPTEVPYKIKQLAIAYALMTAASNKSRMNQRGEDGVDAYELKRKVFAAKVDNLTNYITATPAVLLGPIVRSSSIKSISLARR